MLRLTIIFLLFIATPGWSQTEITWLTLTDVKFTRKYFEEVDEYLFYPQFGATVKSLEGTEVYLQGYMLPIAPEENIYILSRYPFASCFFCGASGPAFCTALFLVRQRPAFFTDLFSLRPRLRFLY